MYFYQASGCVVDGLLVDVRLEHAVRINRYIECALTDDLKVLHHPSTRSNYCPYAGY